MPSPFPGMNPYLEGNLWTSFHHELAVGVKLQLSPLLEPRYVAITERYSLMDTGQEEVAITASMIYPDVGIVRTSSPVPFEKESNGCTATQAPVLLHTPIPHPVPHYRLAIRDVESRKLVTVVEFLSPANKRGQGRKQYLRKRNRILRSSTHLIEIDLLRKGKRTPLDEEYPAGAYFVIVSRANKRPRAEVWPIALSQVLPTVPVPLLKKDHDVPLDLQEAISHVYDTSRFKYLIDYRKPADVPLTSAEETWADQLLRAQGLR